MRQWSTQEVIQRVKTIPQIKAAFVSAEGEDHTTQQIRVEIRGTKEAAFIRGFVTDSTLPAGDLVPVEMVEVSTNYSDGELPDDAAFLAAYGYIRAAVVSLGHKTVNSLESYF
jgi:hypothetical protein